MNGPKRTQDVNVRKAFGDGCNFQKVVNSCIINFCISHTYT